MIGVKYLFRGFFFFSILFISSNCFGQLYPPIKLDTINKYDGNKHKIGYWVEYLDKCLIPAKKKENATFFRYSYYQNGKRIVPPLPESFMHHQKKCSLVITDSHSKPRKDTITMLNGSYKLYDKKGEYEEFQYMYGLIIHIKTYASYKQAPNTYVLEDIDFERKYKKYPFSCSYLFYSSNGNVLYSETWYWENGKKVVINNK